MEPETTEETRELPKFPENACQNCGNPNYETDYKLKLCTNCRNSFSRLNVPMWLKLFAGCIIVTIVVLLCFIPKEIGMYMDYSRAEKAFGQKKYHTALVYYQKVKFRGFENQQELDAKKFQCYLYEFNIDSCVVFADRLDGQQFSNTSLLSEVQVAYDQLGRMFYGMDTLGVYLQKVPADSVNARKEMLAGLIKKDPEVLPAVYMLSDMYFNEQEYQKAIELIEPRMPQATFHQSLTNLLIACYRETKAFDKAFALAQQLQEINPENPATYSALCKLELKRKNDKKALEYAQNAYDLDSAAVSTRISMALALYFNNDKAGSARYFKGLEKEAETLSDSTTMGFYKNIVSPDSKWRD